MSNLLLELDFWMIQEGRQLYTASGGNQPRNVSFRERDAIATTFRVYGSIVKDDTGKLRIDDLKVMWNSEDVTNCFSESRLEEFANEALEKI